MTDGVVCINKAGELGRPFFPSLRKGGVCLCVCVCAGCVKCGRRDMGRGGLKTARNATLIERVTVKCVRVLSRRSERAFEVF